MVCVLICRYWLKIERFDDRWKLYKSLKQQQDFEGMVREENGCMSMKNWNVDHDTVRIKKNSKDESCRSLQQDSNAT